MEGVEGGFWDRLSPFIPLANTIAGNTKYQLVRPAAAVAFKYAFVVIAGAFKRMGRRQPSENCQQTAHNRIDFFSFFFFSLFLAKETCFHRKKPFSIFHFPAIFPLLPGNLEEHSSALRSVAASRPDWSKKEKKKASKRKENQCQRRQAKTSS